MNVLAEGVSCEIRPVQSRKALSDFLRVPFALYAADPNWVAPLEFERRGALSPKNPFFEHADWQAWVAYQGDTPVARISAQFDRLYVSQHGAKVGYFGMFECPNDAQLAQRLFDQASSWLHNQGAVSMVGPFNLGINQELGILVDGFDTPPYFMMPHGLPYYDSLLKALEFTPAQDLFAYTVQPDFDIPPVMSAMLRYTASRVTLRQLNARAIDSDLEILRDIFNDAWSANWGFVPFTQAEFNAVGHEMLMLISTDFIHIAEVDGEPAAFIVLLPNLNEAIADLRGRLVPWGWAKLLWRLKVGKPQTGRVPLMGVRRKYHGTRLGPGLAYATINEVRTVASRVGMREVEMSWILEDNMGMRNIIGSIGGQISKRYRMYQRPIPSLAP